MNIRKKNYLLPIIFIFGAIVGSFHCQSSTPLRSPTFEYEKLAKKYFRKEGEKHFPLTIQRGVNVHPAPTQNGYLFYTTNIDGSGDIWMRDLHNTNNIPIIKHPAEQYRPSVTKDGEHLVFISEDRDKKGDLYFVTIEPKTISEQFLKGVTPTNYWDNAINISFLIQNWSKKNFFTRPECQGSYGENDPHLSKDGNLLLFISDRCNPGLYNVWLAEIKGESLGSLQQLSTVGGTSPRFSYDTKKIVFVSSYARERGGRVYIMERDAKGAKFSSEKELPLPKYSDVKKEKRFHYAHPNFTDKNNELIYTSIRSDTNQNGVLDSKDNSAIYSVSLVAKKLLSNVSPLTEDTSETSLQSLKERKIIEESVIIDDLIYSNWSGGTILYSANLYRSINIYFIPSDGVIPKEQNIEKQYELSQYFLKANEKRYTLALDAIGYYFSKDPEYELYEARVLVDRLSYLIVKDEKEAAKKIEDNIQKRKNKNLYIDLIYGMYKKKEAGSSLLTFLTTFQKKIFTFKQKEANNKKKTALFDIFFRNSLAKRLLKENKLNLALSLIKKNTQYRAKYIQQKKAFFIQADIEMKLYDHLPPILNRIASTNHPRTLEKLHIQVYNYYSHEKNKIIQSSKLQKKMASMHLLLRGTIKLIRANTFMASGQHKKSLELAYSVQESVPKKKSSFRFLPKQGWRSLYTNSWITIEKNYKLLGQTQNSISARIEIFSTYDKESQIPIKEDSIEEITRYFSLQNTSYLSVARSLAKRYKKFKNLKKEQSKKQYTQVLSSWIDGIAKGLKKSKNKEYLLLSGVELEVLSELCYGSNQKNFIYQRLNSTHTRNYIDFCNKNQYALVIRDEKKLLTNEFQNAISLLYAISYTNIKVVNFILFNMHHIDSLPKSYERSSIDFQRFKVDIVAEKNEQQLHILPKNLFANLITGNQDVYNSNTFQEVEKDYRLFLPQAILSQNLSTIYGYAYFLIKKNIDREKFHFKLQEMDAGFSSDFLFKQKKEILFAFKNAEQLLKYILYINPLHTDSYLLLGWMYQYIDEKKQRSVRYRPSLFSRLLEGQSVIEKDKNFYKEIYTKYFSRNYYEENIELYQQVLQKIQYGEEEPQTRARLHLNLANNYFILLNSKEANENYRKVLEIAKDLKKSIFENEKQEVLFYFNFARSLMYENKHNEAILYLNKCYDLYEKQEYLPLKETYNDIAFVIASNAKDSLLREKLEKDFLLFKSTKKKLRESRARMALLSALTGLAYWQEGYSQKAIEYYRRSEYHLHKELPKLPKTLEYNNLLNFLALAYQETDQLDLSDELVMRVIDNTKRTGIIRNDEHFQPKDYCAKSLGCILNFGEDFSVVGKGRNPYGFSSLRQHELALSIHLENMIIRGNLTEASKILSEQQELVLDHDIDVKHGQVAYLNSLNQEAVLEFNKGNYRKAADFFFDAAANAKKYSDIIGYQNNSLNHFKSWLAFFEGNISSRGPNMILEKIKSIIEKLKKFEENYIEQIKDNFISNREKEFAGYEYDKSRDSPFVIERAQGGLAEIKLIEAILLYYQGQFIREKFANSFFQKDIIYFDKGVRLLQNLLGKIEKQKIKSQTFVLRSRYNLVRLYFASGRLHLAKDLIEVIIQDTFKKRMYQEEMISRLLFIQILEEMNEVYQNIRDVKYENDIEENMERIYFMFLSHPHLYKYYHRDVDSIQNVLVKYFIKKESPWKALEALEKIWLSHLQWEYFRYPILFANSHKQKLYNSIRKSHLALQEMYKNKNQDGDEWQIRVKSLKDKIEGKAKLMARLFPRQKVFLSSLLSLSSSLPFLSRVETKDRKKKKVFSKLKKDQVLIRFYLGKETLQTWCIFSNKKKFISDSSEKKIKAESEKSWWWNTNDNYDVNYHRVFRSMQRCFKNKDDSLIKDIFIIATKELFHLNFRKIVKLINPILPVPTFTTRISDEFLGSGSSEEELLNKMALFPFRAGSVPKIFDDLLPKSFFMQRENVDTFLQNWRNENYFNDKNKTGKNFYVRDASKDFKINPVLTLLETNKGNEKLYKKTALGYEILRSFGVSSIALAYNGNGEENGVENVQFWNLAGKRNYTKVGSRIFGFSGFSGNSLPKYFSEGYRQFYQKGRRAEKKLNYALANTYYQNAASYLSWHPQKEKLFYSIALDLWRTNIIQWNRGERKAIFSTNRDEFDEFIEENDNSLEKILTVIRRRKEKKWEKKSYFTAIKVFLSIRAMEKVSKYRELYLKEFPEEKDSIRNEISLTELVSCLDAIQCSDDILKNQQFSKSFLKIYPILIKHKDLKLAQDLFRHAQYGVANKLLAGWEKSSALSQKIPDIKIAIAFDRFLLGEVKDFPFSLLFTKETDPYLKMLYAGWQGRWEDYEKHFVVFQSTEVNIENRKSQKDFYEQWRNFLEGKPVYLNRIATEWKRYTNRPFYIDYIERSIFYHLLINTLEFDIKYQNARLLDTFLKREGKNLSKNRILLMALQSTEKYLEQEDFFHALHFFDHYLKILPQALLPKEITFESDEHNLILYREARAGSILDAMGLRFGMSKYYKKWGKNILYKPDKKFLWLLFRNLKKHSTENLEDISLFTNKISTQKYNISAYQDLNIAIALLQWQLLQKEDWKNLLNLSFFKQKVKHYAFYHKKGYKQNPIGSLLNISDQWRRIQQKIPKKQIFIALIDTNQVALRLVLNAKDFFISPLEKSGQYFRAHTYRYLRLKENKNSFQEMQNIINDIYRRVLGENSAQIKYLWLPSIHNLAPIYPRGDEKIYQVLNVESLLTNPYLERENKFHKSFQIEILGERTFTDLSKEETLLQKRIYQMEKFGLDYFKKEKVATPFVISSASRVYHIFETISSPIEIFTEKLRKRIQPNHSAPWFLSSTSFPCWQRDLLSKKAKKRETKKTDINRCVKEYNVLLESMGKFSKGIGVIFLQKEHGIGHAYFVRQFYDRNASYGDIAERFHSAHLKAKQEASSNLNYRLVTGSFFKKQKSLREDK